MSHFSNEISHKTELQSKSKSSSTKNLTRQLHSIWLLQAPVWIINGYTNNAIKDKKFLRKFSKQIFSQCSNNCCFWIITGIRQPKTCNASKKLRDQLLYENTQAGRGECPVLSQLLCFRNNVPLKEVLNFDGGLCSEFGSKLQQSFMKALETW